jgi:hypothetical protein
MIDYLENKLFERKIEFSNLNEFSRKTALIYIALCVCALILIIRYIKFHNYSNIINQIPGPPLRNKLIGNLDLFYISAKTKHWFQSEFFIPSKN